MDIPNEVSILFPMEQQVFELGEKVEGLTVKNISQSHGDLKVVIHVKDFLHSLSNLPQRPNGTVHLKVSKLFKRSQMGHTHEKPKIILEPCAKTA